jgi:hypothetical protein
MDAFRWVWFRLLSREEGAQGVRTLVTALIFDN